MKQPVKKANAIEKTLTILQCFIPYNQEIATFEMAERLGYHKATTNRILRTLSKNGFLRQDSKTKKFMLGPTIVELGRAVTQSLETNLIPIAKPYIDALRDKLKETITLEVLSGKHTFMAYIADGPQLIRLAGRVGDIVPINAAAGAKAILAFSPPDFVESMLDIRLQKITKNTITDKKALLSYLREVRARGVSFDHEEVAEGTYAIGAPIFNHDGTPIAAVIVAGPPQRISFGTDSEMITSLKETAEKISAQLYYQKTIRSAEQRTVETKEPIAS